MKTLDSRWDEALADAVSFSLGEASGCVILYLEEREDAVVEVGDPDGEPAVVRSHLHGLAGRSAPPRRGPWVHLGAPHLEDARELALAATRGRRPRRTGGRTKSEILFEPSLETAGFEQLLVDLIEATRALQPAATLSARWVGFRQVVRIAHGERSVFMDVRQGGRIRLEARSRPGDPQHVCAVTEAVVGLSAGSPAALVGRLSAEAGQRFAERRRAVRLMSGERPVVFGPGVGGVLAHEIVGHALEADAMLAGASWLAEARGRIAAADLTVIDDPRRGRAAWRIDDEGTPARPVALVRHGTVAGWLHDADSCFESGQPATGHGRRASFRDPVRPRMGCTFVAAGRHHPHEAFEGVEDGIYVRRMEAASTDPTRGRAIFRVTDADRIVRGRIGSPVVPHLLRVESPRALAGIDCIADDVVFDVCVGSCLRDGQPLPASTGAPTFRLSATAVVF